MGNAFPSLEKACIGLGTAPQTGFGLPKNIPLKEVLRKTQNLFFGMVKDALMLTVPFSEMEYQISMCRRFFDDLSHGIGCDQFDEFDLGDDMMSVIHHSVQLSLLNISVDGFRLITDGLSSLLGGDRIRQRRKFSLQKTDEAFFFFIAHRDKMVG